MIYVEYLEARSAQIAWDTGVKLTSLDEVVTLDLMPVSGSGVGDAWYAYLSDGEEKNLLLRVAAAYQVQPNTSKGYAAMFGNATGYKDGNITGSDLVVDSRVVAEFSRTQIKIGSKTVSINASVLNTSNFNIIINGGGYNNDEYPNVRRCQSARYYEFKIMSGDTTVIDLKPVLDDNLNPCFHDEVSGNFIYHIGSGTPTAGPVTDISGINFVEYLDTDSSAFGWNLANTHNESSYSVQQVELVFEPLSLSTVNSNVLTNVSGSSKNFNVIYANDNGKFYVGLGSNANQAYSFQLGQKYKVNACFDGNGDFRYNVFVNGTSVYTANGGSYGGYDYIIKGSNTSTPTRIYSVTFIYTDNTIQRFLPCIVGNDNVPCLYDTYNRTLNLGNGLGNLPTYGNVIKDIKNFKIGDVDVESIYVGNESISKIYIGSDLCYSLNDDNVTYADYIDVNKKFLTFNSSTEDNSVKFRIKGEVKSKSNSDYVAGSYYYYTYSSRNYYTVSRLYWDSSVILYCAGRPSTTNVNENMVSSSFNYNVGDDIDITFGNIFIYDNLTQSFIASASSVTNAAKVNYAINLNLIKLYSFDVIDNATDEVIANYRPAYDENGNLGIYETISKMFILGKS